ncbi:hypothetical protein FKM82_028283, partial [Ascaphus truei]
LQRTCCLLVLALLSSLAPSSQSAPDCCQHKTCSCRVYDLLRGSGNHAAGILTLGKRKSSPQALQSRLQRLLQGSGNQAAGILTMGRREQRDEEAGCAKAQVARGYFSDGPPALTLYDQANVSKGLLCQQDPNM